MISNLLSQWPPKQSNHFWPPADRQRNLQGEVMNQIYIIKRWQFRLSLNVNANRMTGKRNRAYSILFLENPRNLKTKLTLVYCCGLTLPEGRWAWAIVFSVLQERFKWSLLRTINKSDTVIRLPATVQVLLKIININHQLLHCHHKQRWK